MSCFRVNEPKSMPSTFHQFRLLPAELRIQIWSYALEESRIVRVRLNEWHRHYRPGYSSPLLRTCSESRAVAIRKQHDPAHNYCWDSEHFSYDRSILYFGSAEYHKATYSINNCVYRLEPRKIKSILFLYRPTGPLTDTSHEMALILAIVRFCCRNLDEIVLCPVPRDPMADPIPRDIDCMTIDFPDTAANSKSLQHWRIFQPYRGSWDLRLKRGERRMLSKLEAHFSKWRRAIRANGLEYSPPRVKFLRPPIPVEQKQEHHWGLGIFPSLSGGFRQLSPWKVGTPD
jgi:hypothetical protein